MAFNPTKCSIIRIRSNKRQKIIYYPYKLHGHILVEEEHSKYLGVTISNKLTWTKHIEAVAAKGRKSLGFLRRNFWQCNSNIKSTMYTTLVRPVLEYASPVWNPSLQKNIHELEKVQRSAARFATNNYKERTAGTMTRLLKSLKWDSLEYRRKQASVISLFRIVNNLVDIDSNYIQYTDSRTRGPKKLFQPRTTTPQERESFFAKAIPWWNKLPDVLRDTQELEAFKTKLASFSPTLLN